MQTLICGLFLEQDIYLHSSQLEPSSDTDVCEDFKKFFIVCW